VEELDWWDQTGTAALPIALTPAHHFSARTPFDRNRALWGGFFLRIGDRRVYFAGDTAYSGFFPEIPQRLGPIDLALLPIGAYEPRWFMQAVHMNPAEAVQAYLDLGSPATIGMHFGTFQLTSEGIDDPAHALEQACRANDVPLSRFRIPGFGQSIRLELES
jgi:L-ascorbate metabolism protein UlaG (beta-lactamase superfamily)